MSKTSRNKRERDFRIYILDGLKSVYDIQKRENGSYTIETDKYGVIDIYPKADKVLIRDENKWIENGLEWVCNNL